MISAGHHRITLISQTLRPAILLKPVGNRISLTPRRPAKPALEGRSGSRHRSDNQIDLRTGESVLRGQKPVRVAAEIGRKHGVNRIAELRI